MKLITLKALKASIAHWERMKKNPDSGEEPCSGDCPLCKRFNGPAICCRFIPSFERCPVRIRTGSQMCIGSPYVAAYNAWDKEERDLEEWQDAAQEEIDFLRSLLPKE